MLSRRNVRVKVMQVLYAQNRDESLDQKATVREYWKKIEDSFDLLLFSLYNLINITRTATDDYEKRKAKHLPSELDKVFTPKLWNNSMIQGLVKNKFIQQKFEKKGFAQKVDKDHFRSIYFEFCKEDSYTQFLSKETDNEENLEMLLELFRFCRRSELFNEIIEDHYANWEDDKSLIIGTIKKVFKVLPSDDENFIMEHYPDEETCKQYGEFLLNKTFSDNDALLKLIEPVLKNWDADRVAILDMIMLKMALCEFIYCPTIPTKVTLNEYVELAKSYSTSKSKEFVNGILDKLLSDLKSKSLIVKEGRGLLDE
ncbi:MAG: transcription antitermination factor NusB [Saprospiraceae bacterium]|nr:transcription antitermination factor NusB [Saprospiraceae bacterium]